MAHFMSTGDGDSNSNNNAAAVDADPNRPSTKFVHKLYRMVCDPDYQHLICWNTNGTSVVVTHFDEFAKEVLGKHFKHSNFSSFIRQLNMYGFYKVNKTPRGHRNAVDTQVWEFSHPKFLRNRPDLLDDIRRKALDSEHARVEARDLQYSVSVGQMHLRAQVDEMHFRLDECLETNMSLRGALTFPSPVPWHPPGKNRRG
ncbi:related to heat shock factor protein 4 [Ceraceosorus bombacis]|uniref:Related to heat shock factor protein 4 n=1 Tax=Ceraceosorus bombacis TaxID=401625 RepID=A0A0P1B7Y7_9BASI|nr:related to heat shock factor protein 4 [Ceraceosorus bombacis]